MATRECVVQVLDLLVRSKPGARFSHTIDEVVEAWWLVLEPLADETVLDAAVMLSREPGDFLPSAGTLYDRCLDLMDDQPPADDAWALVERKARGNAVELSERAAAALATMPDWRNWTEDEAPFRKREFIEAYNGLRTREKREAALALPAGEGRRLLDV